MDAVFENLKSSFNNITNVNMNHNADSKQKEKQRGKTTSGINTSLPSTSSGKINGEQLQQDNINVNLQSKEGQSQSKKLNNYNSRVISRLNFFYKKISAIYRYNYGEVQLSFLWDGSSHNEFYKKRWIDFFKKEVLIMIEKNVFLKTLLSLTILQNDNLSLHQYNLSSFIRKKFKTLISNKIQPILCIGESENEFNAKQTLKVLENQLYSVLEGANIENCIIAYEPVWAIGTGKTPEVNLVNDIHEHIKDVVQSATTNNFLPNVIYGGSLNEENASSFFGKTHIDGSLVGGASLNAESFVKIIKEYSKVK